METTTPRRTFLQAAGAAVSAAALPAIGRSAVGDKIIIGFIGPGGMGMNHVRELLRRKDVEIAYVCDPDSERRAAAAKAVEAASGKAPKAVADMRTVYDDKAIDAVWVATPDHWHTPASILAMKAGKHVYVEKPCSHNIREGRLLVETARETKRLLQVGTQSRSCPTVIDGIARVKSGEIGEILTVKAWNSQLRRNIGKTAPSDPPAKLDFDLWCGPAPMVPYRSNMLPGIWRWWYDFGVGDIGNDGVHDIDVALWGFGATTQPSRVTCFGGKYFFDDDQQFPDTQYAVFEYPVDGSKDRRRQFIFEQRIWSPYVQEGYENGAAFYGTKGLMVMGHSVGWKLYGPKNKLIAEKEGRPELVPHHNNFLDCIRGTQKSLNAPAEVGHLSASICHLANIAARTGKVLEFDPKAERITNEPTADALVKRKYRDGHWAVPKGV